ncbi:uncharacterized protein LOC116059844 isoform X1 [Sander lucioperca]|uniref:uncharacterized protein LOC116059844 isoform X1 n=1 Tax=Sander lucioperca TaxID=283035 RepID=UPI00125E9DAB|nr:uncharacterized protein LOC116059844 isoform X1 [Sander lucioperca]
MAANTYRMTDRDITRMIQLRATNTSIFTGKRNSAMRGWRAIRREMGLQGTMTAWQLKKKWDNLKEKYKVMKNPPAGMESLTQPSSWRWFRLMDEALSGRLAGTAPVIEPSPQDEDDEDGTALPRLILPDTGAAFPELSVDEKGTLEGIGALGEGLRLAGAEACGDIEAASRTGTPAEADAAGGDGDRCQPTVMESHPVINTSQPGLLYATLLPSCTAIKTPSSSTHAAAAARELDEKRAELQGEWRALEREQAEFERELIALERDRELLNRDTAALERDRTLIERDRAVLDRDRAFLDRDRAFLDRDRAVLERDRAVLDRDREDLERERALWRRERDGPAAAAVDGQQADMATEKEVVLRTRFYQSLMAADVDPDQRESRQRLVSLFQKLVEKL